MKEEPLLLGLEALFEQLEDMISSRADAQIAFTDKMSKTKNKQNKKSGSNWIILENNA